MVNEGTVIHVLGYKKPTEVARVSFPRNIANTSERLEYCYRHTQNIQGSWSLKIGKMDANNNVTVTGPSEIRDGKKLGIRSTTLCDVIQIGHDRHVVAISGFKRWTGIGSSASVLGLTRLAFNTMIAKASKARENLKMDWPVAEKHSKKIANKASVMKKPVSTTSSTMKKSTTRAPVMKKPAAAKMRP